MWSSPLLLSLSSVFALLGLSLVGIAVLSDNWVEYQVNRREIINAFNREPELNVKLKDAFVKNSLYYTRNYGLFHICFGDTVPSGIGSFSKFGSPCVTNTDYFPSTAEQDQYNTAQWQRLYLMRGAVISYVLGLAFIALSFMVGFFGCWKRSPKLILTTALMMLCAVLFLAGGMACWHYVNYMERYILEVSPFYRSWESILKSTTRFNYGWSYIVSWVGISFLLFASIFMLLSYKAIKDEEEKAFEAKHGGAFMIPNYYDKGAMVPAYGYNTYGGYGAYPGYYNQYNGYYGYMTYGR